MAKGDSNTLSETNYREFAQKAIEKYGELGRIADMILWASIIKYYEAEITELQTPKAKRRKT